MGRLNWKFFLVLAAVLALCAGAAQAALVASNHDMPDRYNLSGAANKSGACSFCHIPHGAASARLFPPAGDNLVGLQWAADPNANMCWQCHGAASSYAGAPNVNPFQNLGNGVHGRDYNKLVTWGDVATKAAFEGYGIPYTVAADNSISCASCHNAHDNDKRPFIRDINGSNYTEGNFATWCVACHVARGQNANTASHVNHPMNDNIVDSAAANIVVFGSMTATFFKSDVSNLNITMTTGGGAGVTTESWNLGGHTYTVGGNMVMHCGTCHAVHSNETTGAGWGTDDGATAPTTAVANANNFLAVYGTDPAAGAEATICTGCHDVTAGAGPGIGGVSHPYVEVGPWTTTITNVNSAAFGSPKWGGVFAADGAGGTTLVCQSCHDVHFARLPRAGTNAPDNNFALMRVACGDCHNTSTRTGHHPSNVLVEFGTNGYGSLPEVYSTNGTTVPIGAGFNWATIDNATKVTNNAASRNNWSAGTGTYPFDNGTKMTCNTCHGGGAARAHNNTAFPALTGTMTNDTMCIDCHGTNPSFGLSWFVDNASRVGTHMVGVPGVGANISTVYKWNYGAATPVTPASNAVPRYGLGAADNGALVCTSCHTLKITGITAQYSNNAGDGESSTVDCVALLLTPSGNSKIDDGAATGAGRADFLCSACHGATPGGGFSHPTLPSYDNAASATLATKANLADTYVTLYSPGVANRVNCESCHRPHNAAGTVAGLGSARPTFILEDIGPATSYMQEDVFCNRCHAK